jgi:dihydrofolate reductase
MKTKKTNQTITMIVAVADNGVIGYKGSIPWNVPEDLKRFKDLTLNKPIIMGRKTFESLPKLLPNRRHLVLTNDLSYTREGIEVYNNIEDLLEKNKHEPELFVIGGTQIYKMFEGIANKIESTQVHCSPAGDTFFEPFTYRWIVTDTITPEVKGTVPISFITLKRSKNFNVELKYEK